MRDCQTVGHIHISDDPHCLACDQLLTTTDTITIRVDRQQGELTNPQYVAAPGEWGPLG